MARNNMRKSNLNGSVGFERLELRRLLAADGLSQVVPETGSTEALPAEMATLETVTHENLMAMNSLRTNASSGNEALAAVVASPARQLDLADGSDGFFGTLNEAGPAERFQFTANQDGMATIVLTSSWGDAHATLSASTDAGEAIEMQSQVLNGFEVFRFEVVAGDSYQVSLTASDADCEGSFQLTVGLEDHQDQHANQLGTDSTELIFSDHDTKLSGRLEAPGDVDTFRFAATASGEAALQLQETVADMRVSLNISVHDAAGNLLAEGRTNEMLQSTFDVLQGEEYFVSVSAAEGQSGTYHFSMSITPDASSIAEEDQAQDTDASQDVPGDSDSQDAVSESDTADTDVDTSQPDEVGDDSSGEMAGDQEDCDPLEPGTDPTPTGEPAVGEESMAPDSEPAGDESIDTVGGGDEMQPEMQPGTEDDAVTIANTPDPGEPTDSDLDDLTNAVTDCDDAPLDTVSETDTPVTSPQPQGETDEAGISGELIPTGNPDDATCDTDLSPTDQDQGLPGDLDEFFAGIGNGFEFYFGFSLGDNFDHFLTRV